MIKDNFGDWGICIATWRGMRPGKPGIPGTKGQKGTPGVRGSPGGFVMSFINLRDRSRPKTVFGIPAGHAEFKIDSLKVVKED